MGVQYRGEPEFVIEGNPSGIRGRVAAMKTCSENFDQVGESLGGVETEHWMGKAADRFRSRLEEEPQRWSGAADGFRSAAAALEGYAAALEAAQQAAQVCRENYEEGNRVSKTAKADYDRDVSEGFQKKAAWEAQNGPGTYTLTITPFTDPGQALRDRAIADFQVVIEDLEKTGSDTEQAVAQAHADADPTRQWPNKAGTGLGAAGSVFKDVANDEETDKEYGTLDPAVAAEWDKLSLEERKKVLQEIVDGEFAKYGIKAPKISFQDKEKTLYGWWNEGEKELMLNENILDDPRMIINTAAHEARHAMQHEMIRDADYSSRTTFLGITEAFLNDIQNMKRYNLTPEEVEAWEDNFSDYKTIDDDGFDAYYDQPVERDAREAGRDFVNSLSPGDFSKYKQRAGVK